MSWLSKSLRNKLIAGSLLAVLALILLPIFYAWSAMAQVASSNLVKHTYGTLTLSREILADLREIQLAEIGVVAISGPEFIQSVRVIRERIFDRLAKLEQQVRDNPAQYARCDLLAGQIQAWLNQISAQAGRFEADEAAMRALVRGEHGSIALANIIGLIRKFMETEDELLAARSEIDESAQIRNMSVVLIGTSLAILTFVGLAFWLTRSLIDPIRELTAATARIQKGDLRARVTAHSSDELGQLSHGFNNMAVALQRNARELEKRDVQADVLQVAQVLAATNDLPHLLDKALEQVMEAARCPAGAIWVRSPEDECLRALVAIGTGAGLTDQAIHAGEGILGRVAQTRIAYFAPADSDEAPLTIHHWIGQRRPAELAYIPLTAGPDLVGVLTLAATEPFEDRAKNLLRVLSGQLGSAIRDALSHQILRRQAVEQKAANERLAAQQAEIERQNRELRVASQLKSEFLANMSHELRTPLTIILGFTNTVIRGAQGPLSDGQADSLRRVYDNAKHLLGLINDILDLSKIEAGQMEIEPEPFDPATTLEVIADSFRPMAQSKGLELRLEPSANLPGQIVADETRLRQVVTNLISNAVKFTDRGAIVIAARRENAETLTIEVRDTGPGIAEEDLPKIFDEFRQLDGATTRKAGGTGLGLSIVRKLVELMGGTLEVRSQVGQGTAFLVRLPIVAEPHAAPTPASTTTPTPRPTTNDLPSAPDRARLVLAIDDDEDFLTLLRAAFQETPFALRCARNGQEGLDLARQLHPDAITLDVMMPEMDGWRVLTELKSDASTAEIPVILLTVLQRRGLGLLLGASDYLTKPVDRDHLVHALHQVVPTNGENGGTILIVDDDPDIRQMLDVELRSQGFTHLATAADGIEGLRLAREWKPDLVILDLMMPRMDGFEMAARLQEDEATRGIPIIVVTAKDLTGADMARLDGQIEQIIQKGALSVDALIERLVAILRSLGVKPV